VENQAQMTFLQQHQCDILQGYYFSKPLPAPNFELWLQAFENRRPADGD
jgi:EAL domain-containing protein (putative c-di-GMP-specific phosphodiesterase class I)